MSRPFAPIAIRMPISRVRSVTETSMMFMIPIPPTSSEIEAAEASSTDSVREVSSAVAAISCCERIMKSESWPGWSRCRWRRSASISFCASSTAPRDTADAMNMSIFGLCLSSRMTVV